MALKQLVPFVAQRGGIQVNAPEYLAKSISIGAAELLDCIHWKADGARVHEELADLLTYCTLRSAKLGVEPERLILENCSVKWHSRRMTHVWATVLACQSHDPMPVLSRVGQLAP